MWSGSMVFFESFSQISFASDEMASTNSVLAGRTRQCCEAGGRDGTRWGEEGDGPLQHSAMRSLTSLVAV